ncbi:hypothetical protein [Hyalangium gracile]|uniref:hypothetical protein n=1 Tax=Hyalangium gracile TaxID=394092 RepID=UPI001CCC498E|nr:hypothetical protein [Hyalangium gracile]
MSEHYVIITTIKNGERHGDYEEYDGDRRVVQRTYENGELVETPPKQGDSPVPSDPGPKQR